MQIIRLCKPIVNVMRSTGWEKCLIGDVRGKKKEMEQVMPGSAKWYLQMDIQGRLHLPNVTEGYLLATTIQRALSIGQGKDLCLENL